jgi:hypothetical protein
MAGHPGRPYAPPQRPAQEARGWQRQQGWRANGGWQEHHSWHEHRAHHWEDDHRSWSQRGGYGGVFIPQHRFEGRFGYAHPFRISAPPTIYMGYPRFRYGGYSFMFVDPWPEYWADDWYRQDDVYIDYDDGYYLYNPRYPGVAIAITVAP